MALTPDDVVTKEFERVRFKEGFDPDEVDDFLDEIVVEWRKTIEENNELKAKLAEYESGATPAPAAAVPTEAEVVEEVAQEVPAQPEAPAAPAADVAGSTNQSAAIIELAQRIHDEHVADGQTKRDELINDAETQARKIIADAEERQREELSKLEKDRATLEGRITELRTFERDYRSQLRTYFEEKLRDLDQSSSSSGSAPVSTIGL